ncbi:hypothetical protein, partial [Ligilactobacillus acidipiscis]
SRENSSTKGLRHYDKCLSCRDVGVDWAESFGLRSSTKITERRQAGSTRALMDLSIMTSAFLVVMFKLIRQKVLAGAACQSKLEETIKKSPIQYCSGLF